MKDMTKNKIGFTTKGIELTGASADLFLKPLGTVSRTANDILRVVENIVGIPADFIANNLETFRDTYNKGYQKIPKERRVKPKLRLGCNVFKNVCYAAEETDIQILFANLLLSGSDSKYRENIHPSYASVISEMTGDDAKVLITKFSDNSSIDVHDVNISKSFSCLIRLGLIMWKDRDYSEYQLMAFAGQNTHALVENIDDTPYILNDLINDYVELKNNLIEDRRTSTMKERKDLVLTQYGEDFLKAISSH